ncbi:MAG: S8 family serine peptidase [Balneolales bacterium]
MYKRNLLQTATFIATFIIIWSSLTQAQSPETLEVLVSDHQTEKPLTSAGVGLYHDGQLVDSAVTDDRGYANLSLRTTHIAHDPANTPSSFEISANYPNPFVDETQIDVTIPDEQTVTAEVYNIIGQRVMSQDLTFSPGYYQLNLSLSHLSTGIYLVRLRGKEQHTVTITKAGERSMFQSTGGMMRVSGGGTKPVQLEEDIEGAPADQLPSNNQEFNTDWNLSGDEVYEIRVSKQGYAEETTSWKQSEQSPLEISLLRTIQVSLQTVNTEKEGVTAELKVTGGGVSESVITPAELTLPWGHYKATGHSESLYFDESFQIENDTAIVLEPVGSLDGIALDGDPKLPVHEATTNLHIPVPYNDEEVSTDPDMREEGRVLRTELEVTFSEEATVKQVNEFLQQYEAGIVSMLEGLSLAVIRFPDPGDVDQLNELISKIESDDIVLYTLKSAIVEDPIFITQEEEPRKIPGHLSSFLRIDHHLAIRGHGAWNARRYLLEEGDHPWLVIADAFGNGAPSEDTRFMLDLEDDDFETDDASNHGYHVTGIISGSYDSKPLLLSGTDDVTGIFPDVLRARIVDLRSDEANTWPRRMNQIITRIKDILDDEPDARIIVNTSLNSRSYDDQNYPSVSWIQRVRGGFWQMAYPGRGLESRFVHFTSAGNAVYSTGVTIPVEYQWEAKDNSMFAYAALGTSVMTVFPSISVEVPKLTNTFVVENRVNTTHDSTNDQRPLPGCANDGSVMKGNLSGIGTNVWSHTANWPTSSTGTSMATPQAAGVAAWVWSLNPDLTVHQVKDLIQRTAEKRITRSLAPSDEDCHDIYPQPVIDVYAAVLKAGGEDVRRSILDVNETGQFDENDLQTFLDEFEDQNGTLDYSRYDLNANGQTGGEDRDRFDLTMNGHYGQASIEAKEFQLTYNETSLRDIDILCYYAFSDLYEGDTEVRDEILDLPCGFDLLRRSPIAFDDYAMVVQGSSVNIPVLVNDYNPNSRENIFIDDIFSINRSPISIIEDNTMIRYTAEPNQTGIVTFDYTIVNESGLVSQPATVSVFIWEGLIPLRPQIPDDVFTHINNARMNDWHDLVISGFDMHELEKAIFLDRHGIPFELESFGEQGVQTESLNRNGIVIGQSRNSDGILTPFRWSREGRMEPLPEPEIVTDIDEPILEDAVQVSESFERMTEVTSAAEAMIPASPVDNHSLIEVDPVPRLAKELAGTVGVMEGRALDINDQGIITGSYGPFATVWLENNAFNLSEKIDGYGLASAVNNQDMIAGSRIDMKTGEMTGFLWYNESSDFNEWENIEDTLINLGSLGGSVTYVSALNEAGQIVGYSEVLPENDHDYGGIAPYLWTPEEGIFSLGTLGGDNGLALDINDNQQVVGTSLDQNGNSAGFLWMDGKMYDVNDFVQDDTFKIVVAFDINNRGVMSVIGYDADGQTEVRILKPDMN